MIQPIDRIKISKQGKDVLIRIKRKTGLQHWNEICRIALCRSLSEKNPPPKRNSIGDSNIEMDWKTFAGNYDRELKAMLNFKAHKDGIDILDKSFSEYFREHLERGIMSLKNTNNIKELLYP
jgi:DNA sulfur modification protein DndE